MEVPKKLKDEIWDYCRMNDITDVDGFINRMIQQGFSVEKFGTTPFEIPPPEVIEKEVIKEVEVVKEVPVEVIREVEKEVIKEVVKEVPVEKIVEREVVKEIYVTDDETVQTLQEQLDLEIKTSEAQVKINEELVGVRDNLINEVNGLKTKLDNLINDTTKDDRIKELVKELEEEKKKPKRGEKVIKYPESTTKRSSINWISRSERNSDDLYDD